jgi:hypothetical protein
MSCIIHKVIGTSERKQERYAHLKFPCVFAYLDSASFHYDGKTNADEEAHNPYYGTKEYSRNQQL